MAKNTTKSTPGNTGRRSSSRRQKTSRTIDLEAKTVSDTGSDTSTGAGERKGTAAGKVESASMQSTAGTPPTSAKKSGTGTSDTKEKVVTENAGETPIKPKASATPSAGSKDPTSKLSPSKSGTSFGALLLSAILGGGVALGGAGALDNAGVLSGVPVIGGLFGSQNDGEADVALQAANDQIASLSERLQKLEAGSSGAGADASADLAALVDRLNGLESRLSEAPASSETAQQALAVAQAASEKADETAAQVEQLNTSIVETAGGGVDMEAVKSALSGDVSALSARIDGVEARLESGVGGEANAASNEALEQLRSELEGLNTSIEGLQNVPGNLESLQSAVGGLSEQITDTGNSIEGVSARVDALETVVNDNVVPAMDEVEKAASAAIESQRVARSVSARAMGTVLEQGGRFASELAAAEALIGQSEAVAGLKDLSQAGILTEAELLAQFENVSNGILEREAGAAAGEGVLDRFMASAKSLVTVRPAGPVEGDSTSAVISRIEAALKEGQLAQAKAEWEQLGETAKAASGNWAMALNDRIRAENLIQTVIGELNTETGREG